MDKLILDGPGSIKSLTQFIKNTVIDAGYTKVVLGVSGGIDSSLSAYLSARALGPENVLALRLPYKTSSVESLEHAQLVIDHLGVQTKTVDISPAVDSILENYPDASLVRKGNVMARIRMINIYDQSAAFPGLVVGTGNKTETLLGYSTLHGDGAFDFNPLADLYKAQVRQLSRELGMPEAIITKAPSADLWAGQTDEEELGFTYDDMDQLLYLLVEEKLTAEACLDHGFTKAIVEEIINRVKLYRFKSVLPRVGTVGQYPVSELEDLPFFSP